MFPSLSEWWSNIICLFFFSAEQWHELPNFPNPNKWGYSLVALNNDVYVTGGSSVYKSLKDGFTVFQVRLKTTVIVIHTDLQCRQWGPKSTILLCKNIYLKLIWSFSLPNESNQVDIFQHYSLFSAKVSLFVTILPPQLNTETLSEETQRGNLMLKRL